MEEIVKTTHEKAQEGDVVLLSLCRASFDMFKDYKDRGNQFKSSPRSYLILILKPSFIRNSDICSNSLLF
jgi:hypothetical protein